MPGGGPSKAPPAMPVHAHASERSSRCPCVLSCRWCPSAWACGQAGMSPTSPPSATSCLVSFCSWVRGSPFPAPATLRWLHHQYQPVIVHTLCQLPFLFPAQSRCNARLPAPAARLAALCSACSPAALAALCTCLPLLPAGAISFADMFVSLPAHLLRTLHSDPALPAPPVCRRHLLCRPVCLPARRLHRHPRHP